MPLVSFTETKNVKKHDGFDSNAWTKITNKQFPKTKKITKEMTDFPLKTHKTCLLCQRIEEKLVIRPNMDGQGKLSKKNRITDLLSQGKPTKKSSKLNHLGSKPITNQELTFCFCLVRPCRRKNTKKIKTANTNTSSGKPSRIQHSFCAPSSLYHNLNILEITLGKTTKPGFVYIRKKQPKPEKNVQKNNKN